MTNRVRRIACDERGIALVLVLLVLLTLSSLVMVLLSMSAFEPQLAQNLASGTRARHVAEAGIEFAYNTLVNTANWNAVLAGATCAQGALLPGANGAALPGLGVASGAFTVRVRNDCAAGDTEFTGRPVDASATNDLNGVVVVTSTGAVSNASKTIQVVIRRIPLPPFPGAVNLPGLQDDTFLNGTNFRIDGRDYSCAANCTNNANWTLSGNADNLRFGVAVQPGVQSNVGKTYEANSEAAFNTLAKQNNIQGKNQTNPAGAPTTGLSAIAPAGSLNPNVMHDFLGQMRAYSGTTIRNSTMSCPMVITAGATPSKPTVTNGCGLNEQIDLGTPSDPKLVYFTGALDPTSAFSGLRANGTIQGAGILVIEDGDFIVNDNANFRWDGIVIVTGRYVGAGFKTNSTTDIYGAFVSMEDMPGEAGGFFEFLLSNTSATNFKASKQNIDMAQFMRPLTTISSWREL